MESPRFSLRLPLDLWSLRVVQGVVFCDRMYEHEIKFQQCPYRDCWHVESLDGISLAVNPSFEMIDFCL